MFMVGSAVFGSGSLACALVHSTGPLIAGRAFTGLGAAFLMPATLSIVVSMFEGHTRARAIGIWAGVGGIGAAAGPLLGGWLLQNYWWGSVFLINVPIAVVAIIGAKFVLPETRAEVPAPLDPVGVILSAAGFAALTYALIVAPVEHWGSATVLSLLAASVVLIASFMIWDGRRASPLFDLELFRNRTFSSGIGALTSVFFAMFGTSFLLSQYIQFVDGYDVFGVGIRFLPLALGSLVTSNIAARVTARFGLRRVLLTGMAEVAVGLGIVGVLPMNSSYLWVGLAFGLIGTGMGLSVAPASNAVMSTLPADKVGAGSGIRGTVQLLGGSFGIAIVGSLATSHYRSHVGAAFGGQLSGVPHPFRASIGDQIGRAVASAHHLPAQLGQAVISVTDRAFVGGMHLAALIGCAVVVVAIIAVAAYIPTDVEPAETTDDAPALHV
jgi:EmrB/QacA subfamily drug resistance transporter